MKDGIIVNQRDISQACNDRILADGYCGTRKDEVAPLIKKDNQLEKQINVFIK